jgi:hypothetical protein
MRQWFTLIAAGLMVSCSMMQPAPPPKAPTAQAPTPMLSKQTAETMLKEDGYSSAALVPSQTSLGGWSGTAVKNGVKENVTVDKNGRVI